VDDDAAYAKSDGDMMHAAAASHADGAASWVRGYDDDEASCVCDCDRDPSRARDEVRGCCTHCSANCCETPAHCHPGPGHLPRGTYYSSGAALDHRTTCLHLGYPRNNLLNYWHQQWIMTRR